MKKLIVLSFAIFSSFSSFASSVNVDNDVKEASFGFTGPGCYEVTSTTVYSVNYGITHQTTVTNYIIFNSENQALEYIQQQKIQYPDYMLNGTGYRTIYDYKQTRIVNCV